MADTQKRQRKTPDGTELEGKTYTDSARCDTLSAAESAYKCIYATDILKEGWLFRTHKYDCLMEGLVLIPLTFKMELLFTEMGEKNVYRCLTVEATVNVH